MKKVVGYVFCQITTYQNHNTFCDFKSLYIDDLCVDDTIRGQGIGKALFEYVKLFAKEIGCMNIDLNVWECNPKAREFYEKCGFSIQKRRMELLCS